MPAPTSRRQTIARRFACLLAGAALAAPALSHAQAFQCSLPRQVRVPEVDTERPRRLPVTSYTLALSWAPEFCRFREDDKRHARQCSGREGRFGFTV
ncbi:MAG: hypothetical protein ACM308_00055, partial [Qipengyuania vulgaris]